MSISMSDILLCIEMIYNVLECIKSCREHAAKDLKELEDILLGLYFSLNLLQKEQAAILGNFPEVVPTSTCMNNHTEFRMGLAFMIKSCLETIQELDKVTTVYRTAADNPPSLSIGNRPGVVGLGFSQLIKAHVKAHWRRIMWHFRGDALSKYRVKLQTHLESLNLVLNTTIWSATNRVEQHGVHQRRMLEGLSREASQMNRSIGQLAPVVVQADNFQPATTDASQFPGIQLSGISDATNDIPFILLSTQQAFYPAMFHPSHFNDQLQQAAHHVDGAPRVEDLERLD